MFLMIFVLNLILVLSINLSESNSSEWSSNKDFENKKAIPYQTNEYKDLNYEKDIKPSSSLTEKKAYALIIGISDYPGSGSDLSYCDDDALGVYSLLINDFNFKSSNVFYFQDSSAKKNDISNCFDQIASRINENDIFFFYYSGHGGFGTKYGPYSASAETPHPYTNNYDHTWDISHPGASYMRVHFYRFASEEGYDYALCGDSDVASGYYYELYTGNYGYDFWSAYIPVDRYYIRFRSDNTVTAYGFKIDKYEALFDDGTHYLCSYDSIPDNPSNYYLDSLLDSKLDTLNCAEKYIVMDSCYSGGMIPETQDIGRYIMSACSSTESSLEDPSLKHGVFSYYFLRSFDYATDSNGDGVKSMEESYSYTYSNTVSRSGYLGYTHHPQKSDGISGDSFLYPAFGNVSLSTYKNNLTYSFDLVGHGLIQKIFACVCNNSQHLIFKIEDLTNNPASITGFGRYSGNLTLDGTDSLTGYGIYAEISGNRLLILNNTKSIDYDLDSLDDVFEIIYGLNPLNKDTDRDGLDDGTEYNGITSPFRSDTDRDGLLDGEEVLVFGTDPLSVDTDKDGMNDYFEVIYALNPFKDDSDDDKDNDGLDNGEECDQGSNPLKEDTDDDDMPDGWEYDNSLSILKDDAEEDEDNDGLSNLEEYKNDTDPNDSDTDGDLYSDGLEVSWGTDPLNPFYSLNAIFLNIAGIILIGFMLYLIRQFSISKNKKLKKLDGKFVMDTTYEKYNVYRVETKSKTVPKVPVFVPYGPYKPAPSQRVYYKDPSSVTEKEKLIAFFQDLIQNKLPPPKPQFSNEGRSALVYSKLAFELINKGKILDSFNYMVMALKLGVPEPINSQIRKILLDSLNQGIQQKSESTASTTSTISYKYCKGCGQRVDETSNFCTNCGRAF